MNKVLEEKRVVNYEELIDLINQGYKPIGDLKKAIQHISLLKNYKEIPVMVRQNQKIIDTYLYYQEIPHPFLSMRPAISEVESESREQLRETFGYKYQ